MSRASFIAILVAALPLSGYSQGTFLYDQQSSVDGLNGEFFLNISTQSVGQSFKPTLSSMDFIRVHLLNSGTGGAISLNLRSNSITGDLLATSTSVNLAGNFSGYAIFLFPSSVPLTPDATYVFEAVVQSGAVWFLNYHNGFGYSRGNMIAQGSEQPPFDLWFREGIVVPEPSSSVLIFAGAGLAMTRFIRRSRK